MTRKTCNIQSKVNNQIYTVWNWKETKLEEFFFWSIFAMLVLVSIWINIPLPKLIHIKLFIWTPILLSNPLPLVAKESKKHLPEPPLTQNKFVSKFRIMKFQEGFGPKVEPGFLVSVHYKMEQDGCSRPVDDSSKHDVNGRAQPWIFRVDTGTVIPCFDIVVQRMRQGETVEAFVMPDVAYNTVSKDHPLTNARYKLKIACAWICVCVFFFFYLFFFTIIFFGHSYQISVLLSYFDIQDPNFCNQVLSIWVFQLFCHGYFLKNDFLVFGTSKRLISLFALKIYIQQNSMKKFHVGTYGEVETYFSSVFCGSFASDSKKYNNDNNN